MPQYTLSESVLMMPETLAWIEYGEYAEPARVSTGKVKNMMAARSAGMAIFDMFFATLKITGFSRILLKF
jgi:hypothetical protein